MCWTYTNVDKLEKTAMFIESAVGTGKSNSRRGGNNKMKVSHVMPCSVNLLTVATKLEREAITASAMFISENPPLLVISIHKDTKTHELIEESEQFVLNIASTHQTKLAKKLGHEKAADKFKEFGIETEKAATVDASIIKGSFASIECKVVTSLSVSHFTLYVAEVIDFVRSEDLSPMVWDMDRYYALGVELT
jgi:flavin reductase (DIM6/NTAB) family NADH-FMN oxidoreductase RutF